MRRPFTSALTVLLCTVLIPSGQARQSDPEWIPIDDPDGARLPLAVRTLTEATGQAFESSAGEALLVVRHIEGDDLVGAFTADEAELARSGGFTPVGEQFFETEHGEGMVFECEVHFAQSSGRVAALYAPGIDGGIVSLWILRVGSPAFEDLGTALEGLLPRFLESTEPAHRARHVAHLREHRVSFGLVGADPESPLALAPVEDVRDVDLEFHAKEMEKHAAWKGACIRQWEDAERGLTLSFQVLQGDQSLGPKEALVHHIAAELQVHERVDKEAGDVPIEMIHLPDALTHVVSDAEVRRHYANNRKAAEAGVILGTFLPRSPFARVTRMRWQEPEGPEGNAGEHVLALYFELRTYARSRSETITRTAVAMLQARAQRPQDLESLEQGLAWTSRPLLTSAPFSKGANGANGAKGAEAE